MKIGIITFHHAKYSYGAVLQSLATCLVCKQLGAEAELINYENSDEQKGIKDQHSSVTDKFRRKINYFIRMYLYSGCKNPFLHKDNIDKVYESLSPPYRHIEQMKDLEYDVLITGSDQVWNPQITGGLDPAFFLCFGIAQKRISYASSMGTYHISMNEQATFASLLDRYDAISVREQFAKEQLQALCKQEIRVVLDPTLLLTKEQWFQHFGIGTNENSKERQPFILTFFVGSGLENNWEEVQKYVEYYHLPVWNIQSHKHKSKHTDKVLFVPSVKEFLQYISDATVIITNSFHGTAFSINFGKEFIPILAKANPARVQNLLNEVNLNERINIPVSKLKTEIDYQSVWKCLDKKREYSISWLRNQIKN